MGYKVILEGTIREGLERAEVIHKLAGLLKKDEATIERLLSGKPRPVSKGLDLEKAHKYLKLIEKTGAVCRVEAEEEEPAVITAAESRLAPGEERIPSSAAVCPRCGYEAASEEDVLMVRGDCPKCGLIVRATPITPATRADAESDDWAEEVRRGRGAYGDRVPASFRRRFLAGLLTFSLFWAVYMLVVYVMIFVVFPPGWIPGQTGIRFLETTFLLFPVLTSLITIGVVSFLVPILTEGRSVGQTFFAIEPLFAEEAQTGGLALAIGFRAAAIAAISFVPGRAVLWICGWRGWIKSDLGVVTVLTVCACLTWGACAYWARRKDDKRGILDFVAGTVQVEDGPMPGQPVLKALLPLGAVAVALIAQVILFPLIAKLFA